MIEPPRRLTRRQSFGTDIGDAVAFGITAPDARRPGEIGCEAVGGTEPRTLPDQYHREAGTQELTDLILDGDPCMLDQNERRETPAAVTQPRHQGFQQRWQIALDGEAGQAVTGDDGEVDRRAG